MSVANKYMNKIEKEKRNEMKRVMKLSRNCHEFRRCVAYTFLIIQDSIYNQTLGLPNVIVPSKFKGLILCSVLFCLRSSCCSSVFRLSPIELFDGLRGKVQ